ARRPAGPPRRRARPRRRSRRTVSRTARAFRARRPGSSIPRAGRSAAVCKRPRSQDRRASPRSFRRRAPGRTRRGKPRLWQPTGSRPRPARRSESRASPGSSACGQSWRILGPPTSLLASPDTSFSFNISTRTSYPRRSAIGSATRRNSATGSGQGKGEAVRIQTRFFALLLLSCALPVQAGDGRVLSYARPDAAAMSGTAIEQAVALYRAAVARDDIRGAVLFVARHGKIVLHEAVGWRHLGYRLPMEK